MYVSKQRIQQCVIGHITYVDTTCGMPISHKMEGTNGITHIVWSGLDYNEVVFKKIQYDKVA